MVQQVCAGWLPHLTHAALGQLGSKSCFQYNREYLRICGVCHGTLDTIGGVRPVGRAQGEAQRRRQFERFLGPQRRQRHHQVDHRRESDVADHLSSWYQRPACRLPQDPAQHTQFLMPCTSLNCSRSILVCRLLSEQGSAGALESNRSPSTTTTRKCTFGGAWRPSSWVRHRSLVDRLPSHTIDSCCVRAWQAHSRDYLQASPRSRALSWPTARDLRGGVRLICVPGRREEHARRDRAMCSVCLVTFLHTCVCTGSRVHCGASA